MTSAASNSANTAQLSSVPYAPVGNISAEIQARVTANTVDDAGFGFAYGSCKILDMHLVDFHNSFSSHILCLF
jgi:hypothetical protein